MNIPLLKPSPPRLSGLVSELAAIEASGHFTNFGPVNTRLEQEMIARVFGGSGACLTVGNATLGLLLAIRNAIGENVSGRRYALMPSFTFAATAQAALWNGLTPLFCDIDPETWVPSAPAEEEILERYGAAVAVVVPYATFGNSIDLARYDQLSRRHNVPVVVDAAASLGSQDRNGNGFGAGFSQPVVFSMHTTKAFSTLEGGLVYCADKTVIARLRAMANFGFDEPRVASLPGLNAKLPEVSALLGLAKLDAFDAVIERREAAAAHYRANLNECVFQRLTGRRTAHTFMPLLLPENRAHRRAEVVRALADRGVGAGTYFSPHLAEHPYFEKNSAKGDLSVTEDIARRVLVLPLSDMIAMEEVDEVCRVLTAVSA
ncbi:MAG TPA: DegT/DnrJ/EryC1/StrS family aminotransferase [Alphaproteobacteria bacterium]|nr:DegT/DnrJ/EryC1/StrS family aminotransferase [Alphaproteobacteria bacterium]